MTVAPSGLKIFMRRLSWGLHPRLPTCAPSGRTAPRKSSDFAETPGEDRRMRVLLVANTLPPADVSGVGEQVLQLAAGLTAAGHQVEVLGRGPGGARGPKLLFPLAVVPAAWRAIRRFRPAVVQVHESDGALVALLARLLRPVLGAPPVVCALLQVSYAEERR